VASSSSVVPSSSSIVSVSSSSVADVIADSGWGNGAVASV
jgi:hypothetical protein